MRRILILAVAGVVGFAGWRVVGGGMPSYLAAWLVWMALPMGALPLVMAMEATGAGGAMLPVLRRALPLLPMGAVLSIPIMLTSGSLYLGDGIAAALPHAWMQPAAFIGRAVIILIALSCLALLFSAEPTRQRTASCAAGLLLHFTLASLAAVDWIMALQPGLASSGFGLLVISAQMGFAGCLAVFILAVQAGSARPQAQGVFLAVLLAGWGFLHFIQFLVVWSANLPGEVVWYQARTPGLGSGLIWFAIAAMVIAFVALPTLPARNPAVLASLAAMLLLVHGVEMLWLVTPAIRGGFRITAGDGLAMLGMCALLAAALRLRPLVVRPNGA